MTKAREEFEQKMEDWIVEYGPDGHSDGFQKIAQLAWDYRQAEIYELKAQAEKLANSVELALGAFEKHWCIDWNELQRSLNSWKKFKEKK